MPTKRNKKYRRGESANKKIGGLASGVVSKKTKNQPNMYDVAGKVNKVTSANKFKNMPNSRLGVEAKPKTKNQPNMSDVAGPSKKKPTIRTTQRPPVKGKKTKPKKKKT